MRYAYFPIHFTYFQQFSTAFSALKFTISIIYKRAVAKSKPNICGITRRLRERGENTKTRSVCVTSGIETWEPTATTVCVCVCWVWERQWMDRRRRRRQRVFTVVDNYTFCFVFFILCFCYIFASFLFVFAICIFLWINHFNERTFSRPPEPQSQPQCATIKWGGVHPCCRVSCAFLITVIALRCLLPAAAAAVMHQPRQMCLPYHTGHHAKGSWVREQRAVHSGVEWDDSPVNRLKWA